MPIKTTAPETLTADHVRRMLRKIESQIDRVRDIADGWEREHRSYGSRTEITISDVRFAQVRLRKLSAAVAKLDAQADQALKEIAARFA